MPCPNATLAWRCAVWIDLSGGSLLSPEHACMKRNTFIDGLMRSRLTWIILALVVGVLALLTQGCNGPPLEPWHTEELTAEFTAQRADEIRTFDDYRQLEDELFAELDEKVYARAETGPEYALARYSPGSAADPRGRSPNWNRSFELPVDEAVGGILLLHGMMDAPYIRHAAPLMSATRKPSRSRKLSRFPRRQRAQRNQTSPSAVRRACSPAAFLAQLVQDVAFARSKSDVPSRQVSLPQ